MTPAQVAYEQFRSDFPDEFLYQWEDAGATTQERWERIANAAIVAHYGAMKTYYEDAEIEP